ncbi:hypothetical protein ASD79_19345 [Caulobacter sp. Root655]|uniref:hypothetical protein n=1 Tax=Caulobacter sp. Root655 TaxID=1736578 RepID=UPI0006FE8D39|nr:hypothetical protein [Caulobacter sp. Root655]KRA65080.1 hypothetical protein ASD79_19345 [Caulobacter sp. Root655]
MEQSKLPKIRMAVRRLLAGRREQHDVVEVCRWLREQVGRGEYVVLEVANFLAHSADRDKGPTFEAVRDFYAMTDGLDRSRGDRPDGARLDLPSLERWVYATLRTLSAENLKAELGVARPAALEMLKVALSNLDGAHPDGPMYGPNSTADDMRVLGCGTGFVNARYSLEQPKIATAFERSLKAEGLLLAGEEGDWANAAAFLCLHLVSEMHLCEVVVHDRVPVQLRVVIPEAGGDDFLSVWAVIYPDGKRTSFQVFKTTLKAADWCAPELLLLFRAQRISPPGPGFFVERRESIPPVTIRNGVLDLAVIF